MYQRSIVSLLLSRFSEPRRFIQVLVGPRQVGKTTVINQLEEKWITAGQPLVVLASADDIAIPGRDWINSVWVDTRTRMALQKRDEAILVFDEIQKADGWSEAVKRNWDQDTHDKRMIKVLLSGSSRMLIQEGLSESLFGRYEQHYLGHWSYPEIKSAFGLSVEEYAFYGAYPGLTGMIDDTSRFRNIVKSSIIEASLNRDILQLTRVDKPALLRQLFELGVQYSGQILSYNKVLGQLLDAGNTTTLARYLHLLDQSGLLGGLEKFHNKPFKTRVSSPKYQVHNNALLTAYLSRELDDILQDGATWRRIVESAVGAHLLNESRQYANSRLFYWNRDNCEVDYVLSHNDVVLGIEVKSVSGTSSHKGLTAFQKEFPSIRTLLVGDTISWPELLEASIPQIISAVT